MPAAQLGERNTHVQVCSSSRFLIAEDTERVNLTIQAPVLSFKENTFKKIRSSNLITIIIGKQCNNLKNQIVRGRKRDTRIYLGVSKKHIHWKRIYKHKGVIYSPSILINHKLERKGK